MAFSVSIAIKSYILFVITCSCSLADAKSSWQGYNASPYVLMRLKRSPQRAYTFSGFDPTHGLAAFATSADFVPYYQYPPSSLTQATYPSIQSRGELYAPSTNDQHAEYQIPSTDSKPSGGYTPDLDVHNVDGKPFGYASPTDDFAPSGENSPDKPPAGGNVPAQSLTPPNGIELSQPPSASPFVSTKKPKSPPSDEDADDEAGNSKSKSSSSASFNAWFPIVLGMYPSPQHGLGSGAAESLKDAAFASNASVKERALGPTVIANSVSYGKSSVASSHAIAYGGDAPLQSYRNKT